MPLTRDQAEDIRDRWRPKFSNVHAFETSWLRYMEHHKHARSSESLETWLRDDAELDQVAAVGDPENYALGPSRWDLNGCYHCYGRGYVRLAVEPTHPEFGKAKRCPACLGADGPRTEHCPKCADFSASQLANPERNQCSKCRQYEDEPAGSNCTNPRWHWPNWRQGAPPQSPVPGWKSVGEALEP